MTTITTSTSIPTPLLSILLKRRADQLQITNVVLHFATTRRNSAAAGGLLLPSPSLDRSRPTVVAAATVQIGQRGSLDEQTPLHLVARPIKGWRRRQRTDLAVARRFQCAIVRRLGSCRVFLERRTACRARVFVQKEKMRTTMIDRLFYRGACLR